MQFNRTVTSILLITTATVLLCKIVAHHHNHRSPNDGLIDDRTGVLRTSYDQHDQNSDGSAQSDQDYAADATQDHGSASAPGLDRDSGGSTTPDSASWSQETAQDHSTSVLVPPNWQLAHAEEGSVQIFGPANEQVVLGYKTFLTPGTQGYTPYMEPERALDWFLQTHGSQLVRVLDRKRGPANPGEEAERITAEVQYRGSSYELDAVVRTTNMQANMWSFQISYLSAPEERFDAEFPTMQRIWNSWTLDPAEVNRRLESAEETHQQTVRVYTAAAVANIHVHDKEHIAIDHVINRESTWENDSGQQYHVPYGQEQDFLRKCREHFMTCHEVPTSELGR
jgi:hypothetical protein